MSKKIVYDATIFSGKNAYLIDEETGDICPIEKRLGLHDLTIADNANLFSKSVDEIALVGPEIITKHMKSIIEEKWKRNYNKKIKVTLLKGE